MPLEIGKWHTHIKGQGDKFYCVGKNANGHFVVHRKSMPEHNYWVLPDCEANYTPIPDPIVKYFNFYEDGVGHGYSSRAEADKISVPKRIGCKKVVFTPGEFDD